MIDSPVFWGVASIATTAIISIVGIKYSLSVKKVRIQKSHESILDTLFTLFVNEQKIPTLEEISRLGRLKCRENNIKLSDLPDEDEYLDLTYAKVLESKIIDKEKRNNLLNSFKEETKKEPIRVSIAKKIRKQNLRLERNLFEEFNVFRKITLLAGFFTIILSMMVFLIFDIGSMDRPIEITDFDQFILSIILVIITVISLQILLKFRQSIKRPSLKTLKAVPLKKDFEVELEKILKDKDLKLKKQHSFPGVKNKDLFFDFCTEGKEKMYFIEMVNFNDLVGMGSYLYFASLNELAKTVKDKKKFNLILFVTNAKKEEADKIRGELHTNWDYIITSDKIKELKKILQ